MNVWLSKAELASLPTSGAAYTDVLATAQGSWGTADINNSVYTHNIGCLAGALIAARTGNQATRLKTEAGLKNIIGTETGPQEGGQEPSLAVSRKLASYVIAADLIDYRDGAFIAWVKTLQTKKLSDGRSITDVHRGRGNNWGTMAGASRAASCAYTGDSLDDVIKVHKGWLGDRSAYAGFKWGALDWQGDKQKPVGINAKGSTISIGGAARNVDGVQPDDQRRTAFTWPPPKGNYPWGALGSVLVTTEVLRRAGTDLRGHADKALERAANWLYTVNQNPPVGDDGWQPHLLKFLLSSYNWSNGTLRRGSNMAFTAWTHQGRTSGGVVPPPVQPPVTGDCTAQQDRVDDAKAELAVAEKALADCLAGR
jgi:hypothetical protein